MGGEGAVRERHIAMPSPAEMAFSAQRMWELPLTLCAGLWNAGVVVLWIRPPHPRLAPRHEEHDQLVVPEPLEASGEIGLFA